MNKDLHRKPYQLEEFQAYAESKGGKCLSTEFKTIHDKLKWQCKLGHVWSGRIRVREPGNTVWCKKCSDKHSAGQYHKLNLNDCHKLAKKFGGKCLSKEYMNARTKLNWLCKNGHSFAKDVDHVKKGNWCDKCRFKRNITEKLIRQLFEKIFKTPFPTVKPKWLTNKAGNCLELDGYSEKLKLAFEYNGEQHYKANKAYPYELAKTKAHDRLKKRICKAQGISLIVIPYNRFSKGNLTQLKKFLAQEFVKYNINFPPLKNIKISVPNIYKDNDAAQIKKILAKEKFKLVSYEFKYGMNYYTIQCPANHPVSRRSGHQIRTKSRNFCKRCLLATKR